MPINCSVGCNIHFYDATSHEIVLGGLIQNGSVTEANFLDILGILLITERPMRVQQRLELGEYDVYCDSLITVNNEPWVNRLISHNVSGRENAFKNRICLRDGKYMDDMNGVSKIDSLQNGFLLSEHIRSLFDQYLLSVNPDDNYEVVMFDFDTFSFDGRVLDPVCRNPTDLHCVSDELLRWHFRQSVFANMRGAGEPIFKHDFTGEDMIRATSQEPYGRERLEMEVAARLKGSEYHTEPEA
ncbi:hypothetical protein BDD12DRAFT_918639 [Trichophaea hybrida]|nr:hypothetical protein BDD12DRAFT_918639 [Trichophaea hybrida]